MNENALVRIAGDVRVSTPPGIEAMTRYVLLEQEDWFEDEMAFVRRHLRPGMRVLDIGANYGVYTLTAARLVGPTGRVWAFEPSSLPHRHLTESRAANRFDAVTIVNAALSDRTGRARIAVNANPELNALIEGTNDAGIANEDVELTSLDACARGLGIDDIAFVKLDAEGHEPNILAGGARFFAENSPLVMFEIKAGATFNLGLVASMAAIGYGVYRLIPGIGQLAPFDSARVDPYQLNAFACKPDRAARLREDGLLAGDAPRESHPPHEEDDDAWSAHARAYPYANRLEADWRAQAPGRPEARAYRRALDSYARSTGSPPADRHGHLVRSFSGLQALLQQAPSLPRLLSFAAVAADLGQRALAVQALDVLAKHVQSGDSFDVGEPFVVGGAYASIDPGDDLGRWVASAIVAACQKLLAFSSYFTGQSTLPELEELRTSGIQTPEMERRRQLIRLRFGLQARPEPSPLLRTKTADNLNPEFWCA
ncbi:MAG: FkbM family methyltransferase [Pseudomonadota bacterium]